MPHVITGSCCNDAACVDVCPVNCIHPAPGEEGFATAELLYIDPKVCIDCGACATACPVNAIYRDSRLPLDLRRYISLNAEYSDAVQQRSSTLSEVKWPGQAKVGPGRLKVAIVGSGPSGAYAASHLLLNLDIDTEVTMVEELPTPWGLVRSGVSPDHPDTKSVSGAFERMAMRPDFRLHLNTRVGKDVMSTELSEHHHAVIYAVGASEPRPLDIPGEHIAGSHSASDFVHWYNGHPRAGDLTFDLSGRRAVVIGNGNVALDIARMLVLDPDELLRTDIADHALHALRSSNIEEVVVLGRRGPAEASYTSPELLALGSLPNVDVLVDSHDVHTNAAMRGHIEGGPISTRLKHQIATEFSAREPMGSRRRIVLRYLTAPTQILGTDRVEGVRVSHNRMHLAEDRGPIIRPAGTTEDLPAQIVIRANGFRGSRVPGVPYDEARGTIPNVAGRVIDPSAGDPIRGVYTTGWIKRGPSGVIGTNRECSLETVRSLIDDYRAGRLGEPTAGAESFTDFMARRHPQATSYAGWRAIDEYERRAGAAHGRPRIKITVRADLVDVAQGRMAK